MYVQKSEDNFRELALSTLWIPGNHIFLNCICMGVLPAYMSVHCVCTVPMEARKECQVPCNWSYRQL